MKVETQVEEVQKTLTDIKQDVKCINNKLDSFSDKKLDKLEFLEFKRNSKSWVQWVPTAVLFIITLLLLIFQFGV